MWNKVALPPEKPWFRALLAPTLIRVRGIEGKEQGLIKKEWGLDNLIYMVLKEKNPEELIPLGLLVF
jgi:hypothetical protein